MASASPSLTATNPDLDRMRRDRMLRLHAAMGEQGVDALVLVGNTNVVYATGAIWPLADAGRVIFERPVAVVLADDDTPHLFSPMHTDDRLRETLPDDHLHGPAHLEFDEGVELFAARLADLVPPAATAAVDD